jgi:lipoprotein-releasing system permease protein
LKYGLFIARRYLAPGRRNRFISFITGIAALGVLFGTASLLISMAILDGFDQQLRSTMVAFMGHIEVTAFNNRPLKDYPGTLRKLPEQVPGIKAASPFVSREAILRSSEGLEGVLLKGILPSLDVSTVRQTIVQGTFNVEPGSDPSGKRGVPGIVLGQRLAERLKLSVGDTAIIFAWQGTPGPNNPPLIERFAVRGIYNSGMAQYDDIYTYTSLDAAQRLFDYDPGDVSGYDVLVKDPEKIEQVRSAMETVLGYPHYPQTVFEIFQSIFAWLDLQRAPIPIILGIIIIVASFNIISTLLMIVLEKTESVGVLSALGARPGGVMTIFVQQGLLIWAVGALGGSLLSLGFTLAQQQWHIFALDASIYFVDAVPVALVPWHYVLVIAGSFLLSLLSTIIPAFIAARLRPIDALRFR